MRYGPSGIRVNAIAPGILRTPAWEQRRRANPEVFERLTRWYPLGRVGEPEDVAGAALFLASDDAAWITGAVLPVAATGYAADPSRLNMDLDAYEALVPDTSQLGLVLRPIRRTAALATTWPQKLPWRANVG